MADQNFRVKNGIGIGTYSFVDINRNVNAGVTTLGHLRVTGITTVGIISAIDNNGAQGIVTFQAKIGIHSNGKQVVISSPSTEAGYTNSYELILPPRLGTDGQTLTIGQNGQLGFTTAGLYEARFYVSSANGDDANDGRAKPVRTIKKAAQLASLKSRPVAIFVEAGEYIEDNPIILYEDIAIVGDNIRNTVIRPLNAGKDLFRVRNGCYVTGFAMKDYVDPAGVPQFAFNNAVAFDDPTDSGTSRAGYAIKTTKPIISRSPYIQNCSILSFLGANGIFVDGNKVTTPNTPIIPQEAENPVIGAQPEFGKSMVAAAFTMVSFGGIGWRCINEGYAQVVSCFQIFCKYGSLTQSGGYLSITNSATNFGFYALRSSGWSPNSFVFDRGRVAATGISGGLQTLKVIGVGRTDQDLYVLRFYNNAGSDQTANFKPVVTQQTFNATSGIDTSSDTFTIASHPFVNGDSVLYIGDEGALPPKVIGGLVSNNQYYLSYIDTNSFKLYEDSSLTKIVDLTSGVVGIHTIQKGNLEFFAKEMLDTHNSYQVLGIGSTANPLNFVSGRQITQPVTGGTAVGYAVTYMPNVGQNGQLLVSVESSGGVRRFFAPTGSTSLTYAIRDHSGSPVSVAVTSVVGITTYYTLDFKVDSTPSGTTVTNIANLPENYNLYFHRPSIINSSSHTWEYSGSGIDYNALPQNGGKSDTRTEQIYELGGRVYSSGTNELGDFKIGSFITAFNRTGNIVFNNKVSIGLLESLRLSLSGGIAVDEFSTDIGLGDNEVGGAKNSRVSTQLAVKTFLNNRLGNFIDKDVSTNAIPSSIVQLNAIGQINADLIPPKVVNYYRANVSGGRTDLVNQIPAINLQNGDTVIEPGNGYVLISDVYSQYLILSSTTRNYNFNNADTVISAVSNGGAIGIVTSPPVNAVGYGTTGLVKGVLLNVSISNGGSGYTSPGIYTCFLDTSTGIGTSARATITVGGGGTVTAVNVNFGGRYYASGNTLTVNNDSFIGGRTGGARFQASVNSIETRLYLKLTNNQKFTGSAVLSDYISDNDAVAISTNTSVGYGKTFIPTDISIGGNIDFANDRIIIGVSTFTDGDPVIYSSNGGNVIGGLTQGYTYYAKRVGISSVELYTTFALSSKLDLTSNGTGTATITRVGVNTDVNLIVFERHGLGIGDPVKVSGSTPTGITTGSYYYVGVAVTNAFSLHQNRTDALASVNGLILNEVGLANTNGGTFTLTKQNVTYSATVNTSSNIFDNWTVLASGTIDASNITSGTVSPSRLGTGSATNDTFLAGDSSFKKVVTSVGIGTTQPIQATASSFDSAPGGIGINTYYGKVNISINRAAGTGDLYSTLGVAKFKTSTFSVDADGAVSIKPSASGDVDASTLGGQAGSYYLDPVNLTGSIPISKGGTGLGAAPSLGAILQGNGLTYDLVTTPTFGGNVTITNNGRLFAIGIAATNISVEGVTGIATFQNFKVTNEVISGVSTFSGSGNNINQTAGTAALNRLTVTGVTTVSTLFFDSLGGTAGATIPYIQNVNTVHTGIVTFSSSANNIQQTAGTAVLNNLSVSGVSTFVSIVNFGIANFGTVDVTGTLSQLNGTVSGVSTFSGSRNNINQTAGTAALNRLTIAGVSTVARLEQSSNETSALQRLTVAGISTFTGQLNAGTISASSLIGTLNNTLTFSSPLTGTSYNNSGAVTLGINATSANTASYVVQRGASGEFSMGALTASSSTFSNYVRTLEQVRATGWYGTPTGSSYTGLAVEMGMSAGQGYVICYNRDTSAYGTLNLQATGSAGISIPASGTTITVTGSISATGSVAGTNITSGGNVTGSSASCTGNSATATTATNQSGGTVSATSGSFSSTVDFTGGSSTVPAIRVRSGGSSWSEGLAIHPSADNGYALTFFRTRTSFTDSTTTWAIGNLGDSSTNNFGLLRNGLTGGSGIRADSIFDVTQAGVFRFGFTPTVGSNTVLHAGNYNSYSPTLTGTGASGNWNINAATATVATSSSRLYSTDAAYAYGSANPYYGYLTYDGSRWLLQVSPGTPASVRVAYSDNSGLLGGLALNTSGRADVANQVVRTDGNGYIQAGWINSTSGDSGFATRLTRITCSNDNYLRYLGLTDFKVSMSLSAKNDYSRRIDYTSDANYHVGSFGHASYGANETFHGGSGFFDIWSGTNFPGGLTHIHGFNALHYTVNSLGSTGGNAYGWQMAVQYNSDNGPWWRRCSAGSFSSWLRLVSYGSNQSGDIYGARFVDSDNTGYYTDPASTSNLNAVTAVSFSGPLTGNVTGNVSGSSGSCSGNAATATNLSTGRTNWSTNGTISAVVGQLSWKNYGNSHTIFDASNSTSPDGGAVNATNSQVAWTGTYPTLMGWNGSNTYGVRVDSARISDSAPFDGLTSKASGTGTYTTSGDFRAPIFYDSNNPAYYTDPASTSVMNTINAAGYLQLTGGWAGSPFGGGQETLTIRSTYASMCQRATNGALSYWLHHLATDGAYYLYGGRGATDGSSWDWSYRAYPNQDGGYVEFRTSARSPIFYDRDNTTYYTDPASTSILNALTVNSTFTVNNGWSYVANNYGYGIVGLYYHTIFQLVFAMGDAYKTTAGGGINNLYGISWSYPSAGGIAGNLDSHGMIVAINGGFGSCMSYSIKASGNVTAYSDERLKMNWKNLPENFVELLSKVKSGSYDRIDGEQLRQVGASAQSLRPILPEAVIEADDEFKTLSISYGNAALVSAIELAKEVVTLKEQLNSQNTIIQSLINRLELLENK